MISSNATCVLINARATSNAAIILICNAVGFGQGQALLIAGDGRENATTTFVELAGLNPDKKGLKTGVLFYSTDSRGKVGVS